MLSDTEKTFRKDLAKLEDKTHTVLVVDTFQSDGDKKKLGLGKGVCRALASLWIKAGIEGGVDSGKSTGAFKQFVQVAYLLDAEAVKHANYYQSQQMEWGGDRLKNVKDVSYALSFGAETRGVDLAGFTEPTIAKGVLVSTFVASPKSLVTKKGFYHVGLDGHALSFYYDGATSYFYDSNSGLWRVPLGEHGFAGFLQAYFKLVYGTKHDHYRLMLFLIEKDLDDGVKHRLEVEQSRLDGYRKGKKEPCSIQ